MRRLKIIYRIVLLLFLLKSSAVFAWDDGFGSSKKINGKYFTIYYAPELELFPLLQELGSAPLDEFLVGKTKGKNSSEQELAAILDALFLRVCDILDMPLYSFHGNIKICFTCKELGGIYDNLFQNDLKGERQAFYVHDLNTIYICGQNFRRSILGHEIGHAIISHYFVVQPPLKIQEVLAGYVEYQLRKSGQ